METKKLKLITHDGSFHTDDIFACATLSMLLEKEGKSFEVIRTRDEEKIKSGDFVFDVGGVHDEMTNRFDHHQVGGAGKRNFGGVDIEYAAFGLVWKKFGVDVAGTKEMADIIEKKLVAPIDAHDNGLDLVENQYEVSPYNIGHFFYSMRPTWREDIHEDEMFLKCVETAKEILKREITQTQDGILAKNLVISIYNETEDKRIIVLDKNYPYEYTLHDFSEPVFIVYPREKNGNWGVKSVRQDPKTFNNRKDFPKSWAGLRDEELQKVTGVSDAVFCHRGLFMAVARSKEGALALAKLALSE